MLLMTQYFPISQPPLIFLTVLLIILFAPIVMGRLRIPHIIGLVLAGVAIGPYGLKVLERDASFSLFGFVGLFYIMFLAGLEMDMEGLRRSRGRVLLFGVLTFLLPFLLTFYMAAGLLGYSRMASLLLGCLMASNTLVAYPIVGRYGLGRHAATTLSVGATMASLFAALVVLAMIVNRFHGESGAGFWLWFVAKFAAFCTGTIFFIPRLTRWFLRRYSDAVMQFIFVLSILFLCGALSQMIGLEGIFGAFMAGLILNRFIPKVSPLMNRLEFTGNALFIPYFLIGVGMQINLGLLFEGGRILLVVACITIFGTLGKALAAYLTGWLLRFNLQAQHLMFGLTSAHAAGAIAMVMVGLRLQVAPGKFLFDDEVLNGIVIMILITCIISSLVTEQAAKHIVLAERERPVEDTEPKHETVLIPVKYPEYANRLTNLAMLMRNPKRDNYFVALSVVYDDDNIDRKRMEGTKLLEQVADYAASADVRVHTQLRVAANIANGIMHAFKECRATEIVIGMHMHFTDSTTFWGKFHQSLFGGLSRQIIMARLVQPLSTLRRIVVSVPSRAQFEPGFYRWLERLSRLAGNLDCRIAFHGRSDTLELIQQYERNHHESVRAEYVDMEHWNELPKLASQIKDDHVFVVVTARKGTVSFKNAMERLPEELTKYFSGKNLMIIFPDQYGDDKTDVMTFAQSQHFEDRSAYEVIIGWVYRNICRWKTAVGRKIIRKKNTKK